MKGRGSSTNNSILLGAKAIPASKEIFCSLENTCVGSVIPSRLPGVNHLPDAFLFKEPQSWPRVWLLFPSASELRIAARRAVTGRARFAFIFLTAKWF